MKLSKKLLTLFPILAVLFIFAYHVSAAAPDGSGPWADNVVSSSQGLMKNGLPVPAARSDTSAALGVAENDTVDAHFFSLGFGGNIVLGFDNGISSGVFVVEATNPNYPLEKAKVEVSEDAVTWVVAGNVTQDGTVSVPESVNCAKFVRITDTSDPAVMPDDIADGYDVDGAQALGDSCTPQPTPTPTSNPSSTPGPTDTPSTTTTTTSNVPGFPNTGTPCTSNGITTIPNVISANRVSPTSIFISWGPDAGLSDFVVQYGFSDGNFQFSTHVSGFSTTIGNLPSNQSIWVQVAATDNCANGTFGKSVLVGGNTPGFPNTGSLVPRLPNTGIGPDDQTFPWTITSGINFIVSIISQVLDKI